MQTKLFAFAFTFLVALFSAQPQVHASAPVELIESANEYPVILVHGIFGWGEDELMGFSYWGGLFSIERALQSLGHDVREAVVSPVGSNWDRAVELYYYIKGGTVDYGQAHSTRIGHLRYGRTFPGLYPDWGTVGPDGEIKKVHLVGHSMGGNTARQLLHLLLHGDQAEMSQKEVSPLFTGGHDWIASITSVNTPHDGSALYHVLGDFVQVAETFVAGIAGLAGIKEDNLLYDFKLDQFHLRREPGEPFSDYMDRVVNSPIFEEGFTDLCSYDLSLPGAASINAITQPESHLYYFSYGSIKTHEAAITKHHVAKPTMWFFLWPLANGIGRYVSDGEFPATPASWPNDGVVSLISQDGPSVNSREKVIPYNGSILPGVWNYMSKSAIEDWDHLEVVGLGVRKADFFYRDLVAMLRALPKAKAGQTAPSIKYSGSIPTFA